MHLHAATNIIDRATRQLQLLQASIIINRKMCLSTFTNHGDNSTHIHISTYTITETDSNNPRVQVCIDCEDYHLLSFNFDQVPKISYNVQRCNYCSCCSIVDIALHCPSTQQCNLAAAHAHRCEQCKVCEMFNATVSWQGCACHQQVYTVKLHMRSRGNNTHVCVSYNNLVATALMPDTEDCNDIGEMEYCHGVEEMTSTCLHLKKTISHYCYFHRWQNLVIQVEMYPIPFQHQYWVDYSVPFQNQRNGSDFDLSQQQPVVAQAQEWRMEKTELVLNTARVPEVLRQQHTPTASLGDHMIPDLTSMTSSLYQQPIQEQSPLTLARSELVAPLLRLPWNT